jgi:DNA polymerase (family 10)
MSVNAQLVKIFDEMAKALELTEANPFKVSAHARVARVLEGLPAEVSTLADDPKKLTAIEGIGDGSARKIIEFLTTGRVQEHDELVKQVPSGLFDVMRIPGLGPKTTKVLWRQGGVTDLASLKAKLDSGELLKLPRMGEKTLENIRASLAFTEKAGERPRLGEALPLAESIIEHLRQSGGAAIGRIECAGSLRRGRETIGDIDIVASVKGAAGGDRVAEAFTTLPGVTEVLVSGPTKASVRFEKIQVDLRIVEDGAFGAAMMYFTGSKDHNVRLRERAIRMGFRLNEYGLFPAAAGADEGDDARPPQRRGVKPVAAKTEEEVYARLGLVWIPPELREDRGEIDLAARRALPELIELADIRAELHAHTTASDGALSIEQLISEAKRRGFHTIAVTDHSKSSVQANGLSPERLREHIEAIRDAAKRWKSRGMNVLAGSEVDIHADGTLDYDDALLAELDIVIASPHASLRQAPEVATERLLAAIRHPLVHIIGHPTGRLINRREGLSPDMGRVIAAALKHDVALEINAHHLRLDLRDAHVRLAAEAGATIAINTDAHGLGDFDELRYGLQTARRGWLTASQCINTWPKAKLLKWLKSNR